MADGETTRHGDEADQLFSGIREALTASLSDLRSYAAEPHFSDRARLDALEEGLGDIARRFRVAESAAAHRLAGLAGTIRHLSAPYLMPLARPDPSLLARLFQPSGTQRPGPGSPPAFAVRARPLGADIAALLSVLDTQRLFLEDLLASAETLAETRAETLAQAGGLPAAVTADAPRKTNPQQAEGLAELANDLVDLVIDMLASVYILANLLSVEVETFVLLVAGVDAGLVGEMERELPPLSRHIRLWQAGLLSARHIETRRVHLTEVYHHRFGGARQATTASLPEGR
ncbi:hypothetical protein [Rhizobium sp. SGZ-381]|uniref:hypothetical protein n=1 Tax=Rhizobium sp. SGZ-381 TaxID=3342800 RepID=UPI00366B4425